MKTNRITIIIAFSALFAGLLAGWLLFGGSGEETASGHIHAETGAEESVWTCSMHPQIRQNEPGDCPICGMDLIPLEEDSQEGADPVAISMSPTAMQLANITTTIAGKTEPVKITRLNGRVLPDERLVVSQVSHFPGRIENLAVNFTGEFVKKGQPVASIYSPELVTAREELLEASRMRDTHPQLYEAAMSKLRNWKLTDRQIEQIIDPANNNMSFDILADVSGYVTGRRVNQGDYVERGMPVYEIADLSRVWIVFDVYEQDLMWINRGDKISFTVHALPGETFEGTIAWLSPVVNPETRVAQARIDMPNHQIRLKPEMFVSGVAETRSGNGSGNIVIPKSAVMWTGKRSLVYVKNQDEMGIRFSMREVTLGPSLGDSWVIQDGLSEGEEIAASGTFSIDAAAQLSGRPSMMMRPESKTMEVPQEFRKQITSVAFAYFDLKNALVNDNPQLAAQTADKVTAALGLTDMSLVKDKAHNHWMRLLNPMNEAAGMIASTSDIEEQREHFNTLSDNIIEMTESFGLGIDTVYRQFCPMAFNDQGAFWLSESSEILNPYFGDMMLRCGEVKQTYRRGQAVYNDTKAAPAHDHVDHHH